MLINFNDRHAITVSGINNCPGKAICDGDLVLFTMKKTIFLLVLVLIMGICTGCGKENTEIENSCMKEQTTSESSENDEIHLDDELNIDFTCDYSEDIKEDVDDVVAASTSLQEELTNMEKVTQKYTPLAEAAQTQGEKFSGPADEGEASGRAEKLDRSERRSDFIKYWFQRRKR